MRASVRLACVAAIVALVAPVMAATKGPTERRSDLLRRANVWAATDIASLNLLTGPPGPGAFQVGETVTCTYVNRTLSGRSPKFACRLADGDEIKVKFGGTNGEVYGELLATRLLWALGFGADRMYSVTVICRNCPDTLGGIARPDHESRFAPALIERKASDVEWSGEGGSGWAWTELDVVDVAAGGAPLAHRDALKLLAVLLQHTDNKAVQQRIVCSGQTRLEPDHRCQRPFLMLNDVGLTFGRANRSNDNEVGGANLAAWKATPVWQDQTRCVGNLRKSFSGTLGDPVISEAGREFLAGLLMQLSDDQLADLFRAAQVNLRLREPGRVRSGFSTIEEWVDAFKDKRAEIIARRCDSTGPVAPA